MIEIRSPYFCTPVAAKSDTLACTSPYVFFVSSKENACISEFDLLLSIYSKWLYHDQFRSYLVYMYIAHFHITHFPNLIILVVTKFTLHVSRQISNHAS